MKNGWLTKLERLKEQLENQLARLNGQVYLTALSPWQDGVCVSMRSDVDTLPAGTAGCKGKATLEAVKGQAHVACCSNPACRELAKEVAARSQ